MRSIDDLRLAALIRLQALCVAMDLILTPLPGYTALKAALDDYIQQIQDARAVNEQSVSNQAILKSEAKTSMIELVFAFVLRSIVKAHDAGERELETSLTFPKTYLTGADDATVSVRAEALKDIMKANLTILTILTPADITKMEDAIKKYNNLQNAPKDAIDYRKAMGTEKIPILLNKADDPKKYIGDLFYSYLPDKAGLYDTAIKIGKPTGSRHISLIVKYTDAETSAPLRKIKATLDNGSEPHEKFSTRIGNVRYLGKETGNYKLVSEHDNYITDTKDNIGITNKKIVKMEIKMVKKTATGSLSLFVYDTLSGKGMPNVRVEIRDLNIAATTDENGRYFRENIIVGTYTGTLSMDNFQKIDFTFTIEGPKTVSLEFGMERV